MKIIIKTKNLRLTPTLKELIEEKIGSLEKFLEIFQEEKYYNHFLGKGKPRVEAWVEIKKITLHHQKGLFFRTECQMRLPGRSIRSESVSENLSLAITEVKDKLQRELKEYKEKIADLTKRRTRVSKKELKLAKEVRVYRNERIREEGI